MVYDKTEEWLIPHSVILIDFPFCEHYIIQPFYEEGEIEFEVENSENKYLIVVEFTRGKMKFTIQDIITKKEVSNTIIGKIKIEDNIENDVPKLKFVREKGSDEKHKIITEKIPIIKHEKTELLEG